MAAIDDQHQNAAVQEAGTARAWWLALTEQERCNAHHLAAIAYRTLSGMKQLPKAEFLAALLAELLAEIDASAAFSGFDVGTRAVLWERLQELLLVRARMLPSVPVSMSSIQ